LGHSSEYTRQKIQKKKTNQELKHQQETISDLPFGLVYGERGGEVIEKNKKESGIGGG